MLLTFYRIFKILALAFIIAVCLWVFVTIATGV